jgi:hypothetical protein
MQALVVEYLNPVDFEREMTFAPLSCFVPEDDSFFVNYVMGMT